MQSDSSNTVPSLELVYVFLHCQATRKLLRAPKMEVSSLVLNYILCCLLQGSSILPTPTINRVEVM
jgi:hypothetical protein